ncbi:KinB-signaling pathway activation protein [Bacillus sp. ISL-40]|uniref:KinB-signaling pathway activation protein n=1 Tax=unclassified Bacillus (in: firmicutes) TaxID=185979 RepID=UPI001BE62A42|nr:MULTISPECIES: KinB-signaling pathway activation protein [unclassified Bacillus (in: firmicutes)]MBT2698311.1 KinB-signaling pathway activation protein [Bacillus sp. ISL-40]MBT2742944.1 KinB-signaling pathway activation protein [Bacillus sp. ISL-77]
MTSRNWVKLFLNTLLVGGLTTAIVGFIVRWNEFQPYFTEFKLIDILSTLIWLIVMGFLFSVISQMGFFAYLTVHRFGLGIFKSVSLWNAVQIVLILFGLFDLVYLRYENFADSKDTLLPYFGPAILLLVVGLIVAWYKTKQTNKDAFIPAMFFMIVVTLVEWVPVLRVNEKSWLYLMMLALLACNAYQLLILHKLNLQSEQERQKKASQSPGKSKNNKQANMKKTKKPSI